MTTPPLQPLAGRIVLEGTDLLTLPEQSMGRIRGAKVAMIFQDPRSSLNPLMRIGDQLARVYALHQRISRRAAWQEAIDMLRRVGIAGPARVARSYAHQLSGGMCQRVMIGRSEEHTSELQSPMYLVCRLLLEKKKQAQLTKYK